MGEISELFWNASIEEMKQGYVYDKANEVYVCLACGERFEQGRIYQIEDAWYEAEKYTRIHIVDKHISMFNYLINLNKKLTGLTDLQRSLITLFQNGLSDNEIVKELGSGSASTIRNHRFTLREKMKQAKVFLSIMELAEERPKNPASNFISIHRRATMIDERYNVTEEENDKVLRLYFKEGPDGPLSEFPRKEKRKIVILRHLIKNFDATKRYTEKEVNEIIKAVYADFVTIRRYFIEYGFMDRLDDCSAYWVKL
ncbi:DUF2087 domain-containing protein [Paenibacillus albiflavus]|uniref:DUF2087 domain-containing protein n=1 Tax=Paenibacillus albiflavus TaxID=2545760 RepID=A0A4R4EIZ4_9BACL|nr:DUF2087 domain-containing protein [Paenibacillus albiflavus]TCZ79889.1 DUF2087 domain-containing protein [Paenibacillus albiflavus]